MRTHSSSNLPVVSPPNPSTSNPKHRNCRRSKQPFILEESPVDMMADQRTMAELLRTLIEGYAEAIVVPLILAEQLELKHRCAKFGNQAYAFSLLSRRGSPLVAKKEPHRSILTWEDLVSKFINEFFHPSRTTNLRNEISNFQQQFDESFHEAWDRYKDLFRTCPHHGFTKLHQLDTFYNALNSADQDSLNAVAGGNLLERRTQDVLTIIENKSKVRYSQKKSGVAQVKSCDANSNSTSEIAKLTHAVNQQTRSGSLPSNTIANPKGELKSITTQSGIVLDGHSVPTPPPFINPKEDERVDETLTDQAVILKKLPEKLGDLGKFLNPCGFNELKCKSLDDVGATINLMPLSVWKKLGLPELIFTSDFVIVDYESDHRVPLILGRPFLWTAHALIDVHREKMILQSINLINVFDDSNEDFLKDLFLTNQPSGNPTFSSHPELILPEVKDDIFDPEGGNVLPEKLLDLHSTKDLHPPLHVNPLSGSTTYSSSLNQLLEEFVDELALITFPPKYDDDLQFDIESDLKEIEYLLHHDPIKDIDSSLKDSIDQSNLADLNNNLVDSMYEMFTDEHALDYSCPLLFDEYDDDLLKLSPTLKMFMMILSTPMEKKSKSLNS
nr:reverse transcriptase domain-containing protein [Tanacetum cinerariifolium]